MPVPTLYHGTDARILRMSQDEIQAFRQDILKTLEYLWPFFEPYTSEHTHKEYSPEAKRDIWVQDYQIFKGPLDYEKDSTLYDETILAITVNKHRLENRAGWKYDGLYLTNWDWQAYGYAKRAYCFGELGLIAQTLIRAARRIKFKGWKPGSDLDKAMDRIITFADAAPEPVVVILENLDISHVKDENGKPLKDGDMSRVFVYDGEINLNDYPTMDSTPSGDSMTGMLEYRDGILTQQKW